MVSFVDIENKAIDKETIILCSVDQSPSKGQIIIKTIWISWPMQEINETYLFLKISSFAHWQTQDIRVYLWCHFCGCCKTFNGVVSLFVANNRCVFFFQILTNLNSGKWKWSCHTWVIFRGSVFVLGTRYTSRSQVMRKILAICPNCVWMKEETNKTHHH